MLYEKILRPLLFRLEPERAHEAVTGMLSAAQSMPWGPELLAWSVGRPSEDLGTEVFGLKFSNPIGLAAGFDKDARLAEILPALGFGFLELGSITLRPQSGNPKPRIFRLPEQEALINRMGFNSRGASLAAERLKTLGRRQVPIGLNLGLNADCPRERAPQEYAELFRAMEPYGDYFAVNVSSPNTTGLRELQDRIHLEKILTAIGEANSGRKPVLVKISPDIAEEKLAGIINVAERYAAGIIAANTTTSREGLPAACEEIPGGLSGAPLRARTTALIAKIHDLTNGRLPIVGVGGVSSGAEAFDKILAGASLIQLYTALVYRGPGVIVRIQRELAERLDEAGFRSVAEAVGAGRRQAVGGPTP